MLDEMRQFIAVIDEGTVTAAARKVHLSQPALSASIRRLEDAVGAPLLDRGRGVAARPTAAGVAFAAAARRSLASFEAGVREIEELRGLRTGDVRVAAGATACTYMLPELVAAFRAEHPGVLVELVQARTSAVVERVADGLSEVGIITGAPSLPGSMRSWPWRADELVVVGPPEELCAADASLLHFVTFGPGSPTRATLDRHFDAPPIAMELGNIAAVKAYVRAGVGRALVSRDAVLADVLARRLRILDDPRTPIVRQLFVVHGREAGLSAAARAFCAELRRSIRRSR